MASPAPSFSPFQRAWWLPSPHLETIVAARRRTPPPIRYEREIIQTRDKDQLALDYIKGQPNQPLLVLLHGLEGCSQSNTIRTLAWGALENNWTVAVPHFRGCGGVPNLYPRAYHAADIAEVGWMLAYCRAAFNHAGLLAVGVSLGGTTLVNYLSSEHFDAPCVTVSMPFDLQKCVALLDTGLNRRLYARHFLKTLRPKILHKAAMYPSICSPKKLNAIRTISEFDEMYTAPLHGFKSAAEYWQTASVHARLEDISSPLLCINALNDPLIPAATLPPPPQNPLVTFCRPSTGGHGAFIGAPANWLFNTVHHYFQQQAPAIFKQS